MKNIHLFETKNAYDAAKSDLIVPRVSYIKNNQDVKYNPTFDANGHEFVEIAGIKWATMNVGAKCITDTGLYFQWGDTKGYTKDEIEEEHKKKFASDWSDYKLELRTKYNKKGMALDLIDDAVHAYMGGSWRMPTTDELMKLRDAVDDDTIHEVLTMKNDVYGLLLTEGDKELFFPACGLANDGSIRNRTNIGYYWLSSLDSYHTNRAYHLYFEDGYVNWQNSLDRYYGFAVRGVLDEI